MRGETSSMLPPKKAALIQLGHYVKKEWPACLIQCTKLVNELIWMQVQTNWEKKKKTDADNEKQTEKFLWVFLPLPLSGKWMKCSLNRNKSNWSDGMSSQARQLFDTCQPLWWDGATAQPNSAAEMLRQAYNTAVTFIGYNNLLRSTVAAREHSGEQNQHWPSPACTLAVCSSDTSPGGYDKGPLCWHRESHCPLVCIQSPSSPVHTGSRCGAGPLSSASQLAGVLFPTACFLQWRWMVIISSRAADVVQCQRVTGHIFLVTSSTLKQTETLWERCKTAFRRILVGFNRFNIAF